MKGIKLQKGNFTLHKVQQDIMLHYDTTDLHRSAHEYNSLRDGKNYS